ncbi:glycerophosphodiester phosphodiesterase 1 isoform X2 [Chelonus insularis]|uniref:glycerophosphodiester phosphodiesterase 1 isoform X2 n=1 Tax=Chelonus insularis TaxID=460826 RepID=UPI00158E65D7|nr:glycerophosphodiester phosphodiesterase 1 isoform X2 [Chelonus insularis]
MDISGSNLSKRRGCNTVEFDLSLTKDKVPIVFHDSTIDRLTGKSGVVKDMTWDELKQLDISYNHPLKEKFEKTETILHFNEAIEQCLNLNLHLFIDIKDPSLEIANIIIDAYKKNPKLYEKAIVTSFHPFIVYLIRRREPKIIASLSYKPNCFSTFLYETFDNMYGPIISKVPFKYSLVKLFDVFYEWALSRFTYFILGISVILLHKDNISTKVVEKWHSRGVRVIAWSVNLPSEKLYFSKTLKVTYLTDTLLSEKIT